MKQIRKKAGIRKLFKEHEFSGVDLVFLLQDWEDGYNVGGMFRVADACGATQILLTGKTPTPENSPLVAVTSMGTHRKVPWLKHNVLLTGTCFGDVFIFSGDVSAASDAQRYR